MLLHTPASKIRYYAITYTDPAQAILTDFFTVFSMTSMGVVRPERFELPTSWFVARRSIQLSYGRAFYKTKSDTS